MLKKSKKKLSPLLKYPGGKDRELIHILPNLPQNADNYYEPFVGGGAVFFAVEANRYFINDKSNELMDLYSYVKTQNEIFLEKVTKIQYNWEVMAEVISNHNESLLDLYKKYKNNEFNEIQLNDQISYFVYHNAEEFNGMLTPNFNVGIDNFVKELNKNIRNKITRMKKLEKKKGNISDSDILSNIEGAFKSAFYMHFRYLYNNVEKYGISREFATAIYFYIREYCYSSMFRYNSQGKFNVPYGGISYNKKSMKKKIDYFQEKSLKDQMAKTTMDCLDFHEFMAKYPPKINDFVFLDPPYDTEFSTYAKNEFQKEDQQRLADYLLNECDAYFMIVIKDTEFIESLYVDGTIIKNDRVLNVRMFNKKYMVSFQNRNDKNVQHLLITNY